MAKKQPEAETAPQAFVEMLREYANAQQAWQRNIGTNVEPPAVGGDHRPREVRGGLADELGEGARVKPGARVAHIDDCTGTVVAPPDGWSVYEDETFVVWDGTDHVWVAAVEYLRPIDKEQA